MLILILCEPMNTEDFVRFRPCLFDVSDNPERLFLIACKAVFNELELSN